ncbi:nitrate reductase [Roseomonas terrae]|jgi:nitrate reductase NapE|uniref:Nitrate reductase n=1 Tax=Neoroseomonas terrae TaxID=424799 RepID=A0ABS5EC67_9PROT|nr:periplasmic nitrate reductase, NapE protein [Neoroseomonas terrae]MBR0648609.1 nitrate reductase [Neoroseomonas terrae]
MGTERVSSEAVSAIRSRRWRELLTFMILAVVIWPFIAVTVVGGWGFIVWMYHVVNGPPGPG